MDLKPAEEQVIVVTGASSGIGLATAQAAAQRGARVVLAARSIDTLERICNDIEAEVARPWPWQSTLAAAGTSSASRKR